MICLQMRTPTAKTTSILTHLRVAPRLSVRCFRPKSATVRGLSRGLRRGRAWSTVSAVQRSLLYGRSFPARLD